MAAPTRLIRPESDAPDAIGFVGYIGYGDFAAATIDHLLCTGSSGPGAQPPAIGTGTEAGTGTETGTGPAELMTGRPAAWVIVADHLDDDLAEEADDTAYRRGIPWLAVEAGHQRVTVGPLVVPGRGPCHGCFRQRRVQHDPRWPLTQALRAAKTDDESLRPHGFVPHQLRITAGIVSLLLASLADGTARPGTVITLELNRSLMRSDLVVGCHGCARCGRAARRPGLGTLLGFQGPEREQEEDVHLVG